MTFKGVERINLLNRNRQLIIKSRGNVRKGPIGKSSLTNGSRFMQTVGVICTSQSQGRFMGGEG